MAVALVTEGQSAWNTDTTPKTATVSWAAGDIIVVKGATEQGGVTLNTPTATGLTFTLQADEGSTSGSEASAWIWSATAGSAGSSVTVSVSRPVSPTGHFGFHWAVYSGASGVTGGTGNLNESTTNLTTAAGDAVTAIIADFNATSPFTRTAATGSGTATEEVETTTGQYSVWAGRWEGCSATTTGYGISDYSGGLITASAFLVLTAAGTVTQAAHRWGLDDGTESGHTFAAAQGDDLTAATGLTRLARFLLQGTGDPVSAAYTLRHSLNGGAYTPTPVGATSTVSPVIEAGDITTSGNNTAQSSWAVSTPAAATGDLIIMCLGWDDATTTTSATPADGPNGETWTQIGSVVASASTEVRATAYWTKATGSWSAGTVTVTPSATESWIARVIKVPAGEFDSTTPIGATATRASAGTAETNVGTPAITAGSSDGGGRLVNWSIVDVDPQTVTGGTGWTSRSVQDIGDVSCALITRDTTVTNSESISATNVITIAGDSWCSVGFIVRQAVTDNPVYVATSANITAGGEATTQRLTGGTGSFTTGRRWDDENGTDTIDLATDANTEVEWAVATQGLANNDTVDLRVYSGAVALDGYTDTPRWTIGAGGTSASATAATGTGTAHGATTSIQASAGHASATGTAQAPQPSIRPAAGLSSGTGAAQGATVSLAASAGSAAGTGAAAAPSGSVAASPTTATATGTAHDATVSTAAATNAAAEHATGTGTAEAPQPSVAPGGGNASGTATGHNGTASTSSGGGGPPTLLATFAVAAADPHDITIPDATANRDLWLIVSASATTTTPSGWTLEASRVADAGTYIFHLPAVDNPGGDIGVTLDHNGSRAVAAIAIQSDPAEGTIYASLVNPPNSTGSTTWGTGAHTFTAREAVFAIYAFFGSSPLPTFTASSYDQGLTAFADTTWAGTGGASDEGARILAGYAPDVGFTADGVTLTLTAAGPSGAAVGFLAFDVTESGMTVGAGTAIGTSHPATASVAPSASAATGTGSGHDATVSTSTETQAAAGHASGTGTAHDAQPSIQGSATTATGTGTASDATVSTGSATNAAATAATGTGTAQDGTARVAPVIGQASSTGTAHWDTAGGSISVELTADNQIPVVGAAHNATVSTATATSASAGNAAGTGTAQAPTASVAASAATATATGSAHNATVSTAAQTQASAGVASGTGTASDATATATSGTGAPGATGAATGPGGSVATSAPVATATGSAHNATVSTTAQTQAAAQAATGTGTAGGVTATVRPAAGLATGTGAATNPLAAVGGVANASAATGTGTAPAPSSRVSAPVSVATGSGQARAATTMPGVDLHPITRSIRDAGHTATVADTGHTLSVRDTGHTATVRENR